MIDYEGNELLKSVKKITLEEAAKDDENVNRGEPPREPLTHSKLLVHKGERVAEAYLRQLGRYESSLRGCDAWRYYDETLFLIEFKNVNNEDKIKRALAQLLSSLITFISIFNLTMDYAREHVVLVVVYNSEQKLSERTKLAKTAMKLAGKEFIGFGFDAYKKTFAKDVHTYDHKEFETKRRALLNDKT